MNDIMIKASLCCSWAHTVMSLERKNLGLVLAGVLLCLCIQHFTRFTYDVRRADSNIPNKRTEPSRATYIGENRRAVSETARDSPNTGKNRAKVYTYNGMSLQQLVEFCSWTPSYECATMDTQFGPIPVYIPDPTLNMYSIAATLTKTRNWEPLVMRVILQELQKYPEAGFIDIGCNLGPFSLMAAKHKRQVVSVDAVVDNVLKLCKSVERNSLTDQVTMVVNPVSNVHETVGLLKGPKGSFEGSHMKPITNSSGTQTCSDEEESLTVLLDDLIPLMQFKKAVLKVDVESFEYHVVTGGKKFFEEIEVPSIIMEWQHVKERNGQALVDIMKNYKYVPYPVQDSSNVALSYSDFMTWTHDVLWIKTT